PCLSHCSQMINEIVDLWHFRRVSRRIPEGASAGLEPARFDPETLAPCAARRNALQILVQSTCREIQRVDNAGRRLDADEGPLLRRPERHGSVVRAEADVEALRFAGDSDRRSALQVSQQ